MQIYSLSVAWIISYMDPYHAFPDFRISEISEALWNMINFRNRFIQDERRIFEEFFQSTFATFRTGLGEVHRIRPVDLTPTKSIFVIKKNMFQKRQINFQWWPNLWTVLNSYIIKIGKSRTGENFSTFTQQFEPFFFWDSNAEVVSWWPFNHWPVSWADE